MADLRFVRMKSGFYVSHDAQFRIVRRTLFGGAMKWWYVEQWDMRSREYVGIGKCRTLKLAREQLRRVWAPVVEE